jgi:hypothetical protein
MPRIEAGNHLTARVAIRQNLELAQASEIENRELVRPSRPGYCQRYAHMQIRLELATAGPVAATKWFKPPGLPWLMPEKGNLREINGGITWVLSI